MITRIIVRESGILTRIDVTGKVAMYKGQILSYPSDHGDVYLTRNLVDCYKWPAETPDSEIISYYQNFGECWISNKPTVFHDGEIKVLNVKIHLSIMASEEFVFKDRD